MDSRKVSSLSMMSDVSEGSFSMGRSSNLIIESIGDIAINEAAVNLASLRCAETFISLMSGDSKVFLAELKLRSDSDCVAARSALLELPGVREDKKYIDATILQSGPDELRLALLGERKNKERFVSVVEVVTTGRGLTLGREICQYDKTSMLGKALTHISSSAWSGQAGEADIFTCGAIIRKLKLEGEMLKPTSGRVQVPPECVDGTLCLRVVSVPNKNSYTIVSSFRTKSAGKNKYQINWFSGRNDEISAPTGKSSLKLSDDQEPSVILSDPRDSRAVYVICNNNSDNSSALFKLVRARKLEDPITTFPFQVTEASMVVGGDKSLFLVVLDVSSCRLKVFQVMKTQGYRGCQANWSRCPELQSINPSYHAVSCSQCKWQLSPSMTDLILSPRCHYQLGLATLLTSSGDIAMEPESATQYRLRALGGDTINDVILIILDDIERSFESEEESLSSMTLKICMNSSPGREGMSTVSGWLMAGRLASVEIFCTRLDSDSFMDSDRLQVQSLQAESFKSYLLDQDWTQRTKREGTFVLDSPESGSAPASRPSSIRSSTPHRAQYNSPLAESRSRSVSLQRIPVRKMTTPSSAPVNVNGHSPQELALAVRQVEDTISPLARANNQIRDTLADLERSILALKTASAAAAENNNDESFNNPY